MRLDQPSNEAMRSAQGLKAPGGDPNGADPDRRAHEAPLTDGVSANTSSSAAAREAGGRRGGAAQMRNFGIRAAPPKARGMPSRKILLSGATILGGLVAFALVTGLSPRERSNGEAAPKAFRPAVAPESLRNGPLDYAQTQSADAGREAAVVIDVGLSPPADPQFAELSGSDQGVGGRALPPAGAYGTERPAGRLSAAAHGNDGGDGESDAAARAAPILFGGEASSGQAGKDDMVLSSRLKAPSGPYVLQAGSIIPAALRTALNSEAPGRVIAQVTAPVYDSLTGEHLLAPQGSRLLGTYESGTRYGERRIRIVWNRLILPNGYGIDLQEMAAVDQTGAAGLRADVDDHIGRVVAASVISGALSTAANAAQDRKSSVFAQSVGDAAAQEAARVGGRIVDRELDVRPALRVPAGARIKVLIERDIVLRQGTR